MSSDNYILPAVRLENSNEFIILAEVDGAYAGLADILQLTEHETLHCAVFRHHVQEHIIAEFPHMYHRRDPLARLDRQDIYDIRALRDAARLGNEVALLSVHLTGVREEQDIVMGGGGEQHLHEVLLPCRHGGYALAAPLLGTVGIGGQTLYISRVSEGIDALLLLDEIFDVYIVLHVLYLRAALVSILVSYGDELFLQNAPEHLLAAEKFLVIGDLCFDLLVFRVQLFPVQTLQRFKTHIQYGLCLHVTETEALHKALLGVVVRCADYVDDFVDVILSNEQTFK